MEMLRFQCRVEKKITNHGVKMDEVKLGDGMVLVQCLDVASWASWLGAMHMAAI
jgi:hypothetical protein